jgi:nitroimidazol reductase NimA-like FMN-containing flavoprotein (pyridoxamine 5'-phosphate oxidase superfamily)
MDSLEFFSLIGGMAMRQEGSVEELGHDECLTRIATQRLGRLGVVVDGVPLVLPMRFAMDDETVVLQTNQGAKILHAPMTAVSFEVDHVDWDKGEGWSVLIQGVGEDISSALDERSEVLRSLRVDSWAPPPADRWLKIIPRTITGRTIRAGRPDK